MGKFAYSLKNCPFPAKDNEMCYLLCNVWPPNVCSPVLMNEHNDLNERFNRV